MFGGNFFGQPFFGQGYAGSSPQFVKETSATESLVSATETITPANTLGNFLALGIAARGSLGLQTVVSVTDTGGSTWESVVGASTNNGNLDVEVWYSNTTAIAGTVTVTLTGLCSTVLSCIEFSGVDTYDVVKVANGLSTSPATGTSATTAKMSEAVFAFVGCIDTTAFSSQTSGYTPETQHTSTVTALNITAQSAYKIVSATGTQSYGLTSGNNSWGAILIGLYSGTAPIDYVKALTATVKASATQIRSLVKGLTATVSSSGTQKNNIVKGLASTVSSTGVALRATVKGLTATVLSSGSVLKAVTHGFASSVSISGAVLKVVTLGLAATISTSGVLSRAVV